MPEQIQVDLPKFTKEMIQLGLVACMAGFSGSAYKMFDEMRQAFPDSHAPIMGMVYAKLYESRVSDGENLLSEHKKLFEDASDEHKIMQVFVEFFKNNGMAALNIMQSLQHSDDELTKKTVENLLKVVGASL